MDRGAALIAVAFVALCVAWSPADAQTCGDRAVQDDETCDDGNTVGGDGCAANCTDERRITFEIGEGSYGNTQFATTQTDPDGIAPRGFMTLTIGALRAGDPNGAVPFVVRQGDLRIQPIPSGDVCLCLRPTAGTGLPPGTVAIGTLGCAASGLAQVDYRLSQDHNIIDVDPTCSTGTLQNDEVCTGPPLRSSTGGGPRGSAISAFGFTLYQVACGGSAAGPDGVACTSDDPSAAVGQRFGLTTGNAVGEIINVDDTAQRVAPDETCGAAPCDTARAGSPFDCDAVLAEPPLPSTAALAGVDVRLNVPFFRDYVNVLELSLSGPITLTPTATPTPTVSTPTATHTPATATATPPPTESPTGIVACAGDCNRNGTVGIDEIIRGVNIALGLLPLADCTALDRSGDGTIGINELILSVNSASSGCP